MPDDLYERDVLTWSEQQATLLRRLAAGERVNDAVDWQNVIEELEDVGVSQLRACRSFLRLALIHFIKLHAWPASRSAGHWTREIKAFLNAARDHFTPAMRNRVDLAALYADALYELDGEQDDSGVSRPWPRACPLLLDDMLARHPDVASLTARFGDGDA